MGAINILTVDEAQRLLAAALEMQEMGLPQVHLGAFGHTLPAKCRLSLPP
jgi:hypothetical protein